MLLEQLASTVDKLTSICINFQKSFELHGENLNALRELIGLRCDRADSGIQAIGSRLNDLETELKIKIRSLEADVQSLQNHERAHKAHSRSLSKLK